MSLKLSENFLDLSVTRQLDKIKAPNFFAIAAMLTAKNNSFLLNFQKLESIFENVVKKTVVHPQCY